jgi:hypothetical protein
MLPRHIHQKRNKPYSANSSTCKLSYFFSLFQHSYVICLKGRLYTNMSDWFSSLVKCAAVGTTVGFVCGWVHSHITLISSHYYGAQTLELFLYEYGLPRPRWIPHEFSHTRIGALFKGLPRYMNVSTIKYICGDADDFTVSYIDTWLKRPHVAHVKFYKWSPVPVLVVDTTFAPEEMVV